MNFDVFLSADTFLQTLLFGVTIGAVYALIALGYTLVYGIIELINFAHGDLFMLGSFGALTILEITIVNQNHLPIPPWLGVFLALIIPMAFCATLNVLIERVAYRKLRHAPRLAPLISAIGMSFILINIGLWWRGANPQSFPLLLGVFGNENLLGGMAGPDFDVRFTLKDLSVILITVPLLLLLNFVVFRTNIGKAMRATAQDREAAALMGINVDRTIAFTFLLGGALAGAAGLIFGIYTGSTHFLRGFDAGLKAFTAAVLGGIGNLYGATLGGFLIGIISAFSDRVFDNRWTNATVFAILIIVLVFRPSGLLGEQTVEKV
ncbi:MAG TPA: branched-chain amino acid ABC transporter permease [Chloroflexia bacterium]|nr:branched-chain amino acid ABC transporter permease [Chloroflexia bacterium]